MINQKIIRQFSHCDGNNEVKHNGEGKQINMNLITSLKCSLNDVLLCLLSSCNSTVGRLLCRIQGQSF